MGLEVCEQEVEQLPIDLFHVKGKWVEQVLHVVLKEGITLITPHSEATPKGFLDKAFLQRVGPEIFDAITESPVHKRELYERKYVAECISALAH